ncbi:protein phosphatase 1 regulatory subunit 3C-like [Odontesthes bonariensis]|uniref:protein phosphatase 1 regulatory subunit 3C-like n=1 Tax=Odontesthes bonariensis TaxID=219752 RepID=UPI003F58B59C
MLVRPQIERRRHLPRTPISAAIVRRIQGEDDGATSSQITEPPSAEPESASWTLFMMLRYAHSMHLSASSSSSLTMSRVPSKLRSCFRRNSGGGNKKRVVFADAIGLELTAIHLFNPEPSSPTSAPGMGPSPAQRQDQQSTSSKILCHKMQLGLPQSTQDFKTFLASQRERIVQLESCSISEHSLSGKVCVSHVSTKKVVHIRMTFDSWKTHYDIPCTFLQHQWCSGLDVDVFSFDINLPQNIDPKERCEFFVLFRPGPGSTYHWDDNRGQNYRVCMEKDESSASQGNTNHCDPTFSKQQPLAWPQVSACIQNSGNLQYLNRWLSSRA